MNTCKKEHVNSLFLAMLCATNLIPVHAEVKKSTFDQNYFKSSSRRSSLDQSQFKPSNKSKYLKSEFKSIKNTLKKNTKAATTDIAKSLNKKTNKTVKSAVRSINTTLGEAVTNIKSAIPTPDMSAVETNINAHTDGALSTIQSGVTTLQGDTTKLKGYTTTIKGDTATIKSDISAINTALSTLNASSGTTLKFFDGSSMMQMAATQYLKGKTNTTTPFLSGNSTANQVKAIYDTGLGIFTLDATTGRAIMAPSVQELMNKIAWADDTTAAEAAVRNDFPNITVRNMNTIKKSLNNLIYYEYLNPSTI